MSGVRIVLLLGLFALAACGQQQASQTYPPQYELNFMRACQAQGPGLQSLCLCTWNKIESQIPPADFAAFERAPAGEQATHPLRSQIETYALACRQEIAAAPDTAAKP